MPETDDKISELQVRLDRLVKYQEYFYREINQLREEIKRLNVAAPEIDLQSRIESAPRQPVGENVFPKAAPSSNERQKSRPKKETAPPVFSSFENPAVIKPKSSLEEYVGRNLISLIGIIITILGVGIGAKYAIDRDLISPLTRFVLGYAFASVLFAVAVWLKKKYLNFSAVVLSGALAMMYFLTFFAYSFYDIFPQQIAFSLMLIFTAFTVVAAINYNRQVIAHIGLVGAYAVPFLLSENSGRADILFSYITIINFGILAISVKKFWKPLYYSAFIITWIIYSAWFFSAFRAAEHFAVSLGFLTVFFLTFYLTFLSYKLIAKEEFNLEIVVLILLNSFIFYGFGYSIFLNRENSEQYLGIFTIANALIHFFVAFVIHAYRLGDKQNLHLALGLSVTFVTIAVPVQFRGDWTTVFWTAEAAYLFWVGRTKRLALYENLAYPLMILACASLLNDWQHAYRNWLFLDPETTIFPLFNNNFLIATLFVCAFAFIYRVNRDKRFEPAVEKDLFQVFSFVIPAVLLLALYNTFRIEIGNYFYYQIVQTAVETSPKTVYQEALYRRNDDLYLMNVIYQINYSMLFLSGLAFLNNKKIKSLASAFVNFGLSVFVLLVFLTVGLYVLGDLRSSYITQVDADYFPRGVFHIFIRYISLACVAALIASHYDSIKQDFLNSRISKFALNFGFDFVFYTALWWIASSELINWMNFFGYNDSYKLGLSILWGSYALLLIILGIIKRKKHLRIGAIALFAVTLIKLFFYDIADLDTISKTVVFVTLGILLLIISFLYNKYKDLIFADESS